MQTKPDEFKGARGRCVRIAASGLPTLATRVFHPGVRRIIVITGTDTGAGKTVLASWLVAQARADGHRAVALKPLCSGGREDARLLHRAQDGALTLDEINPWHFRAPLAPLLAARQERRRVSLHEIVLHVRAIAKRFDTVIVEGAGGLLSPLGEDFDTRDWITALRAEVIIVGRNQLGVVNHLRLTLAALPASARTRAKVVLMSPPRPTPASRTNAELLREFLRPAALTILPWCESSADGAAPTTPKTRRALRALLRRIVSN